MAKISKGKGKFGTLDPPSRLVVPPTAPATRVVAPPSIPAPRLTDRLESRSSRSRDDRQVAVPVPRSHGEDPRPRDVSMSEDELARQKSAHKALISKFGDKLTLEVAGSSKRSDPVVAFNNCAEKLIEGLCLAFSGRAAVRGDAAREAQKKSEVWIVEKDASNAEIARCELEEVLRKAKSDLISAQAKHDRYVKVALPVALEEARAQAVEDFL
ncbi:hypothetical protein TIFTF001_008876 [Ficus carica]|uniref:Uncharacterized protein n=1 Tax=Ficus carica TaxID=3494 RepID=A0AA87ZTD5_FICCA|nr:hypothetical protein TIFTF001_008876 [Ficus carica]